MNEESGTPNAPRTPERIRRDIERTRGELSQTLDALSDELSPSRITNEAKALVREKVGEVAMETRRSVRQNAIPLTLIGCGLALLWRSRQKRHQTFDDDRGSPTPGTETSAAASVDSSTDSHGQTGMAGQIAEKASELYEGASDRTGKLADEVQTGGKRLYSRASEQARRGQERAKHYYDQQPLVVGAAALAVGAAIGAAIPTTTMEHRRLGQYRDDLLGRASHEAEDKLRDAQQAIEDKSRELRDKLPSGDAPGPATS